jgi:hypothetical protein
MLEADAKAECTICIEELKKGDQVICFPCKRACRSQLCVTYLVGAPTRAVRWSSAVARGRRTAPPPQKQSEGKARGSLG